MTLGRALFDAVERGDIQKVEFLLVDKRVDVKAKDNLNATYLHLAVFKGWVNIVKLLLDNGADINAKSGYVDRVGIYPDCDCATSLHCAVVVEHIDVAKFLLKCGADINAKNYYGNTPLHCAAGFANMAELLLKHGADINAKNVDGNTPLNLALKYKCVEVLFILLVYDVTLSGKNKSKIKKHSYFQECLIEFENIKKKPNLGKIIETYKNRDKEENANTLSKYISNETDKKELIAESKNVKEGSLSFIPERLLNFVEYMAYQTKELKTGAVDGLIQSTFIKTKNSAEQITMAIPYECAERIASFLKVDDAKNLTSICINIDKIAKARINILLTELKEACEEPNASLTELKKPQSKRCCLM